MIISRTPFRISFFGGGTDYPAWFRENGGRVLATAIDKYCYISTRHLPPFFNHRYRVVYSRIENVLRHSDIQHPSVRATLAYLECNRGLEIHHNGDLPARSGLGSSSSFTVGLLNALYALRREYRSSVDLAREAIHIEQELVGEHVGSQDQVLAAFGGFNRVDFSPDDSFSVEPVISSRERLGELRAHLMLFFTGISRYAGEVAKDKIGNFPRRRAQLERLCEMVSEGQEILSAVAAQMTPEPALEHGRDATRRGLLGRFGGAR